MEARIKLDDTTFDVCYKMSGGNPGALAVLVQLLQEGSDIDPDGFMGGMGTILGLDTEGIYEARIWMLFKEVCKQDLVTMCGVLRGRQLGYITATELHAAIDGKSELDCTDILKQVRARLPNFSTQIATNGANS